MTDRTTPIPADTAPRVRQAGEVIEEQVMARQEEKEASFIESWYSDEARNCLKEAMKKF